jgi:hypothetical protein
MIVQTNKQKTATISPNIINRMTCAVEQHCFQEGRTEVLKYYLHQICAWKQQYAVRSGSPVRTIMDGNDPV